MTKKDFFRLVIKLFGLHTLILALFSWLPSAFSNYSFYKDDPSYIVWIVFSVVVSIVIISALFFNVDKVMKILKLDKGFDEERIDFVKISAKDLVMFSSILIGGFLLVDFVPEFLANCYYSFKELVQVKSRTSGGLHELIDPTIRVDKFQWLISFINILIGYFLIANYQFIVKKLVKE